MKQMSFADAEYAGKRKQTRRERFLIEMDQVVPWKVRIPRHPATQSTNIRPPIPRSSGQAVGAQRRRFALLV
ncbi:hypothetical protein CUB86_24525 [Pseudomonas syringae pv. actinidiae]|uniref:IS5/IS1182 family transposase n=1 Tax=Pseudomonas syringae pv. actinidiae TaxID=103796 RepID=A0AAU8XNN6_PSESF|nr:hypothetical protein CT122_29000 [Pseudomonas syringae pv. actinidiae]PIN59032.1 hypothetical protein CUB86_24525 [Pseudomonas syringae pv. actinidiae]